MSQRNHSAISMEQMGEEIASFILQAITEQGGGREPTAGDCTAGLAPLLAAACSIALQLHPDRKTALGLYVDFLRDHADSVETELLD